MLICDNASQQVRQIFKINQYNINQEITVGSGV